MYEVLPAVEPTGTDCLAAYHPRTVSGPGGQRRRGFPGIRRRGCAATLAQTVVVVAIGLGGVHAAGNYTTRSEVVGYIDGLVAQHGFDRDWLIGVFAGAAKSDEVIRKISKPAEKALAWHEYRAIFLTDKRIEAGIEFWRRNRDALDSARERFGVSAEVVVAIIGVESFYGRYLGSHRVVDALATLAFDYPPRSGFFKSELTEFLVLVREEGKDPFEPMGSYAGAMGYGQFISSSFRNFSVDFDGDGQRDIWSNETDAIGSVANYFARHGWKGDGPAAVQVEIRNEEVLELADTGLELAHTVAEFRQRGAVVSGQVGDTPKAALFTMETANGAEYWLALHDFHVITRYNRSALYSLAVLQLSEAIRARFDASGE